MNAVAHLGQQRQRFLNPEYILKAVAVFRCLILNLLQGVGKSFAVMEFVKYVVSIYRYRHIIIAVERLDKAQEYFDDLASMSRASCRLIMTKAVTDDTCPVYDERQGYFASGYGHHRQHLCRLCRDRKKCPSTALHVWLKRKVKKISIIITTQKMLAYHPDLIRIAEDSQTLKILDEPGFIVEGIVKFTRSEFIDILDEYAILCGILNNRFASVSTIRYMMEAGRHLLEGRYDQIVLFPIDEETEALLAEKGIVNIHPFILQAAHTQPNVGFGLRVVDRRPIVGDVIIAAPVSEALVRSRFPELVGCIHEINHETMGLLQPDGAITYRINDSCASDSNYGSNSDRINEFMGQLVATRLKAGKRVLLIAKQTWVKACERGINTVLERMGCKQRVVSDLQKMKSGGVPLLHFGIAGVNAYENYDCCFAVTDYNASEEVVSEAIDALTDFKSHRKFGIETDFNGRYITGYMVSTARQEIQTWLEFFEDGVIRQALGRIRPFTKPNKEIIYFHRSSVMPWEFTISSLVEARALFGIKTLYEKKQKTLHDKIIADKADGASMAELVDKYGVHRTTIYRIIQRRKNGQDQSN